MVMPGYKQTEIGMIPEEWSLLSVNELIEVLTDFTANGSFESLAENVTYLDNPDYARLVRLTDIRSNFKNKGIYVSKYSYDFLRKSSLQGGELLLANVGAYAGYSFLFEKNFSEHATLGPNMFLIKANKDIVLPQYMPFIFGYGTVFKQLIDAAASSAQPKINKDNVRKCLAIIPPIYVQERIAQVFSDVDGMISTLEKLVAKKKAIKQGAMQELLTGKKCLPGFAGEWQTFIFGELFDFIPNNAFTRAQMSDSGKVKNIHYGDILTKYGAYISADSKDIPYIAKEIDLSRFSEKCYLQSGDLVIADTAEDETVGKALEVINVECPVLAGQHTLLCRPKVRFAEKFLGYYLNAACYHDQLLPYIVGTKVSSVSKASIAQTKLVIPEYEEQQAIAEILSNMDAEIEALEKKLAKYRQVKQGMMQQLLTGKIRLKNDVVDLVHTEQKASAKKSPVRSAHNHQFDDAVAIAAIVDAFYSDKYPLGRVKVQKLLYLLHRHQAVSVSDFKKKAAGPYADTVRYRGGEPIAKKNKYIVSESGKQGTRYSKGKNMAQALDYVERWGMQADFQWLKDNFLHTSRNDLELFATVDMAICDLNEAGVPISVALIKNLIASNKEWKAKLSKTYFSDSDIARAIKKCAELFD